MQKPYDELVYYFCNSHFTFSLEEMQPGYKFNPYPIFKKMNCHFDGCSETATYKFIGCQVPDRIYDLENVPKYIAVNETFMEAREILSGGTALDKLTVYLYFKIRTYTYNLGDAVALKVCKRLAKGLLQELKILPLEYLTDTHIHSILKELGLYSEETSNL